MVPLLETAYCTYGTIAGYSMSPLVTCSFISQTHLVLWMQRVPTCSVTGCIMSSFLWLPLLNAACPTYAVIIGGNMSNLWYYYWRQHVQLTCATIIGCSVSNLLVLQLLGAVCPNCATITGCSVPNWPSLDAAFLTYLCYWTQHIHLTVHCATQPTIGCECSTMKPFFGQLICVYLVLMASLW